MCKDLLLLPGPTAFDQKRAVAVKIIHHWIDSDGGVCTSSGD